MRVVDCGRGLGFEYNLPDPRRVSGEGGRQRGAWTTEGIACPFKSRIIYSIIH